VFVRRHGPPPKPGEKDIRPEHWWVAYYASGKETRESAHSTNRSDAVRLLKRRIAEVASGRFVGPKPERVTFDNLATLLVNDYRESGRRSLARVELSIAHLRRTFGLRRALDITRPRIDAYIAARLEDKAAPATVNLELAALRRMFRLAERAGLLTTMPYIRRLKVENTRTVSFTDEELDAVLDVLTRGRPKTAMQPAVKPQPDLVALIAFTAATGWRWQSEVRWLEWRRVDFKAGTVSLERGTTKSGEPRTFTFSAMPELEALLRRQREITTALERERGVICPWVFHRDGKQVKDFRVAWNNACAHAGVPGRVRHDLRRTGARAFRALGLSDRDIAELCGWETIEMVTRYLGRDPSGVADRLRLKAAGSAAKSRTIHGTFANSGLAGQK
jgi:integrase